MCPHFLGIPRAGDASELSGPRTLEIEEAAPDQAPRRACIEGNIIERDYDDAGRETHRRVSTLASGFDGDIRRVSTTYLNLGQPDEVVSYDNATVGSGTAQNGVEYTYDGWGGITSFKQDKDSAVTGSGYYEVAYTYAKATAGRNTIRRTGMTQPSGNSLTYNYGTGGDTNNEVSRPKRLNGGEVTLAGYDYLGVADVVGTSYAQPDAMWKMFGSTSGDYEALDRFNRVVTSRWTADLATDVDFYNVDVSYDRNGNITLIEDNVHTGFDVDYSIDDTDRLTQAEEGTWNGSSITSKSRDQQWTLDHLGNWDRDKLDLDGDGSFTGTDEHDDTRTHNDVNELTGRDTDSDSTDDFTLVYDLVGNLTDDGESYKYEYDAFGRMRKIRARGDDSLVAEYEYNGLGFRQASHDDTNESGTVDGDDPWYYYVYDERWRMVSVYRAADSDPKEEFVNHQAGLSGRGGSSYIDLVVCRNRDDNTDWIAASDGVLERRDYYCQNWRADVSVLIKAESATVEWAKYSAYGVPFGMPAGDTDSDGDCDATDITQVQTWINASTYDVRGDVDLDGDVDSTDKSILQAAYEGTLLGPAELSDVANCKGFAGYEADRSLNAVWHVRNRVFFSVHGRWGQRDPLAYTEGLSLYVYVSAKPVIALDPDGRESVALPYGQGNRDCAGPEPGECPPIECVMWGVQVWVSTGAKDTSGWGLTATKVRVGGEDAVDMPPSGQYKSPCGLGSMTDPRPPVVIRFRATHDGKKVPDPSPLMTEWHGVPGSDGKMPDLKWKSIDTTPGLENWTDGQLGNTNVPNNSSVNGLIFPKGPPNLASGAIQTTGANGVTVTNGATIVYMPCCMEWATGAGN